MRQLRPSPRAVAPVVIAASTLALAGCPRQTPSAPTRDGPTVRAVFATALAELNDGPCRPGQPYVQAPLREPMKIGASKDGVLATELVVAFRQRCVPVWNATTTQWEMQTLSLRTYGFPRNPGVPITEADADDPASPKIAWSAPGPTFVLDTASAPGASDGTRFQMRLYNRMPFDDDHDCVENLKCDTKGPNPGVDPATGKCRVTPDTGEGGFPAQRPRQTFEGKVIEPPNCFHGLNDTNFHFHGFHVSPQPPQDNVSLELRPPMPADHDHAAMAHGSHGEDALVAYGHYDFALDPLRYTQAPGTHWYHAHKHGSTALHVLNGQVGSFEIRGAFDRQLESYFATRGGGKLVDRLLVVQQLQAKQPGLGGADQTGAVLVNGQGNPIVTMKRGEVQRWRFIGATMQASAALRIGFPDATGPGAPVVRQIAMDGVQFSPDNYVCQPFLNNPDCSPLPDKSPFDELTAFNLSPGNRVDVLVRAPDTAGTHCMVLDVTTRLAETSKARVQHEARATQAAGTCGNTNGLGPLFTLVVENDARPMTLPARADFPPMAPFLADLPPVTEPARRKALHYEMVNQATLPTSQFWINQEKYNPECVNETLIIDATEEWTLWNNSLGIQHPFHIHQNPFQLISQSDKATPYRYPVWRDVMPIPVATAPKVVPPSQPPAAWEPNSNPADKDQPWGHAVIRYAAKEFTGGFVNHCHILGHEDRGMMHNTQAVCADGSYATTAPVPAGATCDADGFCPGDCQLGKSFAARPACPAPLPQQSDWPSKYGYPPPTAPAAVEPARSK